MDAIPSLCASSASCAIAAVGYALAQPRPIVHDRKSVQPSDPVSLSSRYSFSTNSSTPIQFGTIPRTRPLSSPNTPDLHKKSSGLSGLEEEGEGPLFFNRDSISRPQTGRTNDEIQKRSSWYRRLSIVQPSIDGSVGSPSFQQPSTPSVFSNGSSATPFFGQPPNTVTTRNKLVKRSTSYRGLHSDYPVDSSFALAGKGPTFRRPATSHQRSETLRLRNAQQNIANFEESLDLQRDSWPQKRNRDSLAAEETSTSSFFRPFFRYQQRRIAREPGSRRTSSSKLFGGTDHITSVITTVGEHALLVLGNRVDKPKMDPPRPIEALMEETNQSDSYEEQLQDQDLPIKRTRHSFSTESRPPVSTSWKFNRGGSLRRNKTQDNRFIERRIVSAPLQLNKPKVESSTPSQQQSVTTPSSSAKLTKPSPFDTDMRRPASSNRDSLGFDDSFGNSDLDSPTGNTFPTQRIQPGLRLRSTSRRASRVPSDRSTVFGSDNENSRVFSENGDDIDRRSETIYDSVRTDASGSSHSGARNFRAENVFGDHKGNDSIRQDLSTLQEKLSGISLSRDNDFIMEEEESIKTPVWRRPSDEAEMATPSAKRYDRGFGETTTSVDLDSSSNVPASGNNSSSYEDHMNMSDEECSWDEEFGIDTDTRTTRSLKPSVSNPVGDSSVNADTVSNQTKPNIFGWSEPQPIDKTAAGDATARPKTSHPQQGIDRGGRPQGRRVTNGYHLRSQSVPLPPDSSKHKFNNAKKLDNWILGNKGVSEDWDNDFEFEESIPPVPEIVSEDISKARPTSGIVVPKEILERQATVHGQFGQVKELTLLVEQLRRLHHSASVHGILEGQTSELWKEAAGIIDLATLDEEEPDAIRPPSPTSTSFDFDAFDEDSPTSRHRRSSNTRSVRESTPSGQFPSPSGSKHGTPQTRPRNDSVARAKNVLANIHQRRDPLDPPLEVEAEPISPSKAQKMPFDTTSLRDLVTRAGVVTRACKEIIRKVEDPDYVPHTPERRPTTPPDPPFFSQIFQHSPTPSTPTSDRRNSRAADRVTISTPTPEHKVRGHNVSMMTVV